MGWAGPHLHDLGEEPSVHLRNEPCPVFGALRSGRRCLNVPRVHVLAHRLDALVLFGACAAKNAEAVALPPGEATPEAASGLTSECDLAHRPLPAWA